MGGLGGFWFYFFPPPLKPPPPPPTRTPHKEKERKKERKREKSRLIITGRKRGQISRLHRLVIKGYKGGKENCRGWGSRDAKGGTPRTECHIQTKPASAAPAWITVW